MQLRSMGGREAHTGEHVGLGFVEQSSQLRHLGPDLVGDMRMKWTRQAVEGRQLEEFFLD
jgi:hypothetical protein